MFVFVLLSRCSYKNNLLILYVCLFDIKITLNFLRSTLVTTLEMTSPPLLLSVACFNTKHFTEAGDSI